MLIVIVIPEKQWCLYSTHKKYEKTWLFLNTSVPTNNSFTGY